MSEIYNPTKNIKSIKTFSEQCPYFDDTRLSTIEAFTAHSRSISWYDKYLALGFRRVADIYYRNICENCKECIPLRVLVGDFVLTQSQKKTLKKNEDIVVLIKDSHEIKEENINLYKKYIKKHNGSESGALDDLSSMHLGYANSRAMEYYLDNILVAVSIIDETEHAISSVYCYYDYSLDKNRLGIFTMLKEIEFARNTGKQYCYLGFYIEKLSSMNYKSCFIPNEIFVQNEWVLYNSINKK